MGRALGLASRRRRLLAHQLRIQKTRVVSLSFFRDGAKPEWEDPANHGGTTLTVRAHLTAFQAREAWTALCVDCARGAADGVVGVQVTQKWAGTLKFDVWLRADCDVTRATRAVSDAVGLPVSVAPRDHQPPRGEPREPPRDKAQEPSRKRGPRKSPPLHKSPPRPPPP